MRSVVIDGEEYPVRPMRPNDRGYVYSTWTKELRSAPCWRNVPWGTFKAAVVPNIDRLLIDAEVAVVCDPEDEDLIVAFAVFEAGAPVLHYLHVRGGFRGQGVATQMLDGLLGVRRMSDPFVCTFETRDVLRCIERGWNIVLRPELLEDIVRRV